MVRVGARSDTDDGDAGWVDPFYELYLNAYALYEQGRWDEAVVACDAVIDRYRNAESVAVVVRVADAMSLKCWSLRRAGRTRELAGAVDALPTKFGESTDPQIRVLIARRLLTNGGWLLRLGRVDAAIATSDELISRFERESDGVALEAVGDMLLRIGTKLADPAAVAPRRPRAKRLTPIRGIYFGLSDLLVNAAEHASGKLTADAPAGGTGVISGRGHELGGRIARKRCAEQAFRIFALLAARFPDPIDPTVRALVVKAQIKKAVTLVQLAHLREAKASFDELFALGDGWHEVLSAISNDAERRDTGYTRTKFATALLASGTDIDQPRRRIETLEAANRILKRLQDNKPAGTRFMAWANRRNIAHARRLTQTEH